MKVPLRADQELWIPSLTTPAGRGIPAPQLAPQRRQYVAPQGVKPSVDWWCLARTAAGCIGKCGVNLPCYLTCAPEAAKCF